MNDKRFEVWALGYDKTDCCTDVEILMSTFTKADQACKFADCLESVEDIETNYKEQIEAFGELKEGDYFEVRVETVVDIAPDYSENIETIGSHFVYRRED